MLPIRKYIESGKMSLIYRFLLLIWDAVCINLCSYAALFIRYELKWAECRLIIRMVILRHCRK